MAKIVLRSGREIPVSFFGLSHYGLLYIDCDLPIAEAFTLFNDPDNTAEFDYVTMVETGEHEMTEQTTKVKGFDIFMGVEKLYNGLTDNAASVRVTLMRKIENI